jgi:hypothetical protein
MIVCENDLVMAALYINDIDLAVDTHAVRRRKRSRSRPV